MKKYFLKNNKKKLVTLSSNGGYTIIETMIAISLFLILIMSGMTTLMNAFSVHKKSQNMRSAIDTLSFIMEDMSRNLRTGAEYHCLLSTVDTVMPFTNVNTRRSSFVDAGGVRQRCFGIAFEAAGGGSGVADQWVYYIDNLGMILKSVDGGSNYTQLTPTEVQMNPVSGFYIYGAEASPSDKIQPFVKIILAGSVTEKGIASPFSLETVVSSRAVDTF